MIPILYPKDRKNYPLDFMDNGLGLLAHSVKCEVTEERNGPLELELEYMAWGPLAGDIKEQMLILAKPNNRDVPHLFRIYSVQKDVESGMIIVNAASRTNDLGSAMVGDVTSVQRDPQKICKLLMEKMYNKVPYNFSLTSDIPARDTEVDLTNYKYKNPLECIVGTEWSIIHRFGGEVRRENDGIFIMAKRGFDRNDVIRPGKNMNGFKMTIDTKGLVTAILPWCKYIEKDTQKEVFIEGDIIESKYVNDYPIRYFQAIDFSQEKIDKKDGTQEDITTKEQLMGHKKVKHWFANHDNIDRPKISIDVKLEQFSDSAEVENSVIKHIEQIGLCDTIQVYVPMYKVDMPMKITKLRYDVLNEVYLELSAGTQRNSLFDKASTDTTTRQIDSLRDYTKQIASNLREYVTTSANQYNKIHYSSTFPEGTNHKVGDVLWHMENSEQTQLYIWDGQAWKAEHRPDNREVIKRTVDDEIAKAREELKDAISAPIHTRISALKDEVDYALTPDVLSYTLFGAPDSNGKAWVGRIVDDKTKTITSKLIQVENENKLTTSTITQKINELSTKVVTKDGMKANVTEVIQNDKGIITEVINNMVIGDSRNLIKSPVNWEDVDASTIRKAIDTDVTLEKGRSVTEIPYYKYLDIYPKSTLSYTGFTKRFGQGGMWSYINIPLKKTLDGTKKYRLEYNFSKKDDIVRRNLYLANNIIPMDKPFARQELVDSANRPVSGATLTVEYDSDNIPIYKIVTNKQIPNLRLKLGIWRSNLKKISPRHHIYFQYKGPALSMLSNGIVLQDNRMTSSFGYAIPNADQFTPYMYDRDYSDNFTAMYISFENVPAGTIELKGLAMYDFENDLYPSVAKSVPFYLPHHLTSRRPSQEYISSVEDIMWESSDGIRVFDKLIKPGRGYFILTGNIINGRDYITIGVPQRTARLSLWNWTLVEGITKVDDPDGLKTPMSRLIERKMAGSWSVQNINSAGDIVSQINLNDNGARIQGKNILLDGNVQVTGTAFMDGAVIKDGTIGKAQIADASIDSAKIKSLDAFKITGLEAAIGKVVTQDLIADRIAAKQSISIGDDTTLFLRNGMLQIQKGNGSNTGLSIEVSGRILGPTHFQGKPSKYKYSPVMTNSYWEDGIAGVNGYPTVYGCRWLGIVTWYDGTYLHVDDGSHTNHHFYVKLTKAENQGPLEEGLKP